MSFGCKLILLGQPYPNFQQDKSLTGGRQKMDLPPDKKRTGKETD